MNSLNHKVIKEIRKIRARLDVLERQMERIGAPLYRIEGDLLIQRVRKLPKPDYTLRTK